MLDQGYIEITGGHPTKFGGLQSVNLFPLELYLCVELALENCVVLSTAFEIARSGLTAETKRLAVAAQNIANVDTAGYQAQQVDSVAREGGGVQAVIRPANSSRVDTTNSVDLVREVTSLTEAKAAYAANLAVLVAVDEMTGSLLDAVDNDGHEGRAHR